MSKKGVFSGPNAGKYGPEKIPYWDTFHPVKCNHTQPKASEDQSKSD